MLSSPFHVVYTHSGVVGVTIRSQFLFPFSSSSLLLLLQTGFPQIPLGFLGEFGEMKENVVAAVEGCFPLLLTSLELT